MRSAAAAIERLCDPDAEVSAHYVIARTGEVVPLVAEEMRAWHAGVGSWKGQDDINSRSIGIELDNDGTSPFSEPLMHALETLMPQIMDRWDIPAIGVIGHSDMAPGRKIDPGPKFDWLRLEKQGLAFRTLSTISPQDTSANSFRTLAENAGYTCPAEDMDLLYAVRLRHRPWAKGPLCKADFASLTSAPQLT